MNSTPIGPSSSNGILQLAIAPNEMMHVDKRLQDDLIAKPGNTRVGSMITKGSVRNDIDNFVAL